MSALETTVQAPHSLKLVHPSRWAPLTGVSFAVFFLASVMVSSPPSNSAPAATWIANYTGSTHKAQHVATGICLILAAISLVAFMTSLWHRVARASEERINPFPVAAATVAGACMSVGGVLMGSAASITHSGIAPDASLLRFCNDVGFVMVGAAAMLALAPALAVLSFQAIRVGVFGRGVGISGYVVAVILLAGLAFVPIFAFVIWAVAVAVIQVRRPVS
jgi:hypothetical protein